MNKNRYLVKKTSGPDVTVHAHGFEVVDGAATFGEVREVPNGAVTFLTYAVPAGEWLSVVEVDADGVALYTKNDPAPEPDDAPSVQ